MLKTVPPRGDIRPESMWPCKDGYVFFWLPAGAQGKIGIPAFVKWLEGEGIADDSLGHFDWDTFDAQEATQEVRDRISEPIRKYFSARTKAEILEGAVKHRIMLYPVSTTRDMLDSIQLAARGFWAEVEHPELGTTITYPGAFTQASEAPIHISCRAPLIGEHNQEVYGRELGLSNEKLRTLKRTGVI
jgi:crotonobetainyl-CoA:carnitine CoA-transferase CaiB-like acyl-CoA transferase